MNNPDLTLKEKYVIVCSLKGGNEMKISNVNKKKLATLLLTGFLLLPNVGCQKQQEVETTSPILTVAPTLEAQKEIEIPKEISDMGYIELPETELEMKEIMANNNNVFRYRISREKITVELIAKFYHGIKVDENNEIIDMMYSGNLLDLKGYDYYQTQTVAKTVSEKEESEELSDKPVIQEETITLYVSDGDTKREINVVVPLEYAIAESLSEQFEEMPKSEEEIIAITEKNKQNPAPYYVVENSPIYRINKAGESVPSGTRKTMIAKVFNPIYLESFLEENYEFEQTQYVYRGYTKKEEAYSYTGFTDNLLDLKDCDFYTVKAIRVPIVDLEKRIEEAKENFYPEIPTTQEEMDAIMKESYRRKEIDGVTYEYITFYRGIKLIDGKRELSSWTMNLNDLKEYDYYQTQTVTRVQNEEIGQIKVI